MAERNGTKTLFDKIRPLIDSEIEKRTRSCCRTKSMVVTTAYNAGTQTVGVSEAAGNEINIPVCGNVDVTKLTVGTPVWVFSPYSSMSNAIVFMLGDGKTGYAANAGNANELGGKEPEYYLQPVNLFDNSNFHIAQAGYNGMHGTTKYVADRWISRDITGEPTNNGIRLTGAKMYSFIYQRVSGLKGKTLTYAVKFNDSPTADIRINSSDLQTVFREASYPDSNGLLLLKINATEDELAFVIFPYLDRVNTTGTGIVEWAVLYEGEYTAETLPPYVPKWYSVELAECKRYYRQSWMGTMTSAGAVSFLRSFAETGIRFGFRWGEPMRGVPTVTIYGWATGTPIANEIVDVYSSQNIPISGVAYISDVGFALLYDYTKLTAGKEYIFHYSASADL